MLMNPPMAEDLNVLDQYLTSGAAGSVTFSEPYVRVSSTSKDDSIVYLSVPRQREWNTSEFCSSICFLTLGFIQVELFLMANTLVRQARVSKPQ